MLLIGFVLCSGYDFVLQLLGHVVEVVAVAGDADQQVTVFLGMLLGVVQGGGINDVELDMVTAELEVGADERG